METILNQLSNPFSIDNFKILMSLYLSSNNNHDFYLRVVRFHQDRDMAYPKTPVTHYPFEATEPMDIWRVIRYFSDFFPSEHRIYINSSLSVTTTIVQMFKDECILQNIPFELKYITKANPRSDGIVIGSNSKVYKKHIDILRKIARENPDLINRCGTPQILTATLDGWMGLADENITNRYRSYSQSRLGIFDAAIKSFLIKHPEYANQLEGFDYFLEVYNSYYTNGASEQELSNLLCDSELYNKFKPSDLRTILQNDELAISEIYELFISHLKLQGINPDMPTLYEGSKESLIHTENSNLTVDYTQVNKKSLVSIINDYFSTPESVLDVQDEVHLLKIIDEKFMQHNYIEFFMFSELSTLRDFTDQNIFENNLFDQILSNTRRLMNYTSIPQLDAPNFPSIRSIIVTEGENISNEQAKEIINARISNLHAYFSKPAESIEEMKKCVDTLRQMQKIYNTKNPHFSGNISVALQAKIKYLEFSIQNYDALQEYYKLIASSLEEKTYTNEEVSRFVEKCMPQQIPNPYCFFYDDDEEPPPEYILEEIPEVTPEEIDDFEIIFSDYIHQNTKKISGQDIGRVSYNADPNLCMQADNAITRIQRSNEKNSRK